MAAAQSLDLGVSALVLLAALIHAVWNAMVKVQGDRLVGMVIMHGAGTLASGLIIIAFSVAPPPLAAWPYLVASVIVHTGYYFGLIKAYQYGDLSQVYPIMRGTAPALVAIGAFLTVGEATSWQSGIGLLLVSGGIWSLAFGRAAAPDRRAVIAAFATAATIGTYSVIDGIGGRVAGNAHSYALWMFFFEVFPIGAYALWRYGTEDFAARARGVWRLAAPGGLLGIASYWIVIWAMSQAPLGLVVALRETSVIIAALIGAFLFRETFGPRRIAAAAVVAAGVVLIKLGG